MIDSITIITPDSIQITLAYPIGLEVYYLNDTAKGLVIDWRASGCNSSIEYKVSFGRLSEDCVWCKAMELSESPTF